MISKTFADRTIKRSDGQYQPKKLQYNTSDIISLVLWADKRVKEDTEEFAAAFSPTVGGLRELYDFVRDNIRYKADPKGAQWVKSPRRLWKDKIGDCKSYTLFITSVLQNLGLDYIIRFTSYNVSPVPTHVYPIAILPDGKQINLDVVYEVQSRLGGFGREKLYTFKTDYKVEKGLAYLTGIGTAETPDQALIRTVEEIMNSIPDSILDDDITQYTEGEMQRWLMAQRLDIAASQAGDYGRSKNLTYAATVVRSGNLAGVQGIAGDIQKPVIDFLRTTEIMTAPAFAAPNFKIKIPTAGDAAVEGFFGDLFKAIGKGVKNAVEAVGDALKAAWAKLMNWIFKGPLQKAGPFFLFTYIKPGIASGEVARRKEKQAGVIRFFTKLGMKASNIEAAIKNGIIENMGQEPGPILNEAAGRAISGNEKPDDKKGVGVITAIIEAVGFIIEIIKKVVSLFKKQDEEPKVGEMDTSDLALLPQNTQTGGGTAWGALAAGAAALMLFS